MQSINFQTLMWIGAAGFLGTVARYISSICVQNWFSISGIGTFFVNFIGSLIIGFLFGIGTEKIDQQTLNILTVGFLGGFTTFSAFSAETFFFLKEGRWQYALGYVALTLILGLLATYLGFISARTYV